MPRQLRTLIGVRIARRLAKSGPGPTQAELEGFKEMLHHLWHPALSQVAKTLEDKD